MRKSVVAGNWKMNKNPIESAEFVKELSHLVEETENEVVICAPYIDLIGLVQFTKNSNIKVGAQNMHFEDKGAYTGEVSGEMLKFIGIEYVIIGHSERREYFAETDETVNKKIKKALEVELKPIMCCGETLEQREAGVTRTHLESQIALGLEGISAEDMEKIIIAYEPIWAIGTGKTATPDDANDTIKIVRNKLVELYGNDVAEKIVIQYGGSVKSSNAKELFGMSDIDGGLVGGASLEAEEFSKICNA